MCYNAQYLINNLNSISKGIETINLVVLLKQLFLGRQSELRLESFLYLERSTLLNSSTQSRDGDPVVYFGGMSF